MEKEKFVNDYLRPLLRAMDNRFADAFYKKKENGEEYVFILCKNGYLYTRCVTADSLPALCRDVLEGL